MGNISQTAYLVDCHLNKLANTQRDHGWARQINNMLNERYAFHALQYSSEDYLFRGIKQETIKSLRESSFWHRSEQNCFESNLDVIFCSQDISDALAISRLWENQFDASIVIFSSQIFNNALKQKKAAMLATAEPGVVFKYPFLTHPLSLQDIHSIIVPEDLLDDVQKMIKNKCHILSVNTESGDRRVIEEAVISLLSKHQLKSARPLSADIKPAIVATV